ncbi:2OG-Fe(II) oxygenase, partial [Lysobacter sp. A3-1-A15]
ITAPLPPPAPPRAAGPVAPGTLAFEEALQPAPWTMHSQQPRVMQVDHLLSADECRLMVATATPYLRPSRVVDPETGQADARQLRTSSDAPIDPVLEDFALRVVQLRIARAARSELAQAEHLIVLRYLPGQEYRPHRDYLPDRVVQADRPGAGNRRRTICVYLNAVAEGGETEFPVPGVRIAPEAGRAVVFDNYTPEGRPDPDSLHAGCPVRAGEKWLATLWLREHAYRTF